MNKFTLIIICCWIISNNIYSQEINVPKGPLEEALFYIEETTSWVFNYDATTIDGVTLTKNKQLNITDKSQAIHKLLADTKIDFEIIKDVIIILPSEKRMTQFCGNLMSQSTGQPLAFAHVYVDNHFGTWTDINGRFQFEKQVWKNEKLNIRYLGYKDLILQASFFDSGCKEIRLNKEALTFSEVIIVRDYILPTISKGKEYNGIGLNLHGLHKEMGAIEKDLFRSLQFLPGITSLDESSGNLNIRGTDADQNLILWEGAPLYGQGHFFGMVSVVNPIVNKNIEVYKTAHNASFENRIGGVIDIKLPDVTPKKLSGGFGTTLTEAHMDLHVPIVDNKLGLILAGRHSLSKELNEHPTFANYANKIFQASTLLEDEDSENEESESSFNSSYADINAKLIFHPSEKLQLSSSFLGSFNDFVHKYDFVENQIKGFDSLHYKNQIWSNKLNYQWTPNHKSAFYINMSQFDNEYDFTLSAEAQEEITRKNYNSIEDVQIGLSHHISREGHEFEMGYIVDAKELELAVSEISVYEADIESNESRSRKFHHLYINSFLEWKKWLFHSGIRSSIIDKNTYRFSPRLNVRRSINEHLNFSISTGIFHQYVKQLQTYSQSQLNLENRIWVLGTNQIMESRKISSGLNYNKNSWMIELELYLHDSKGIPLLTSGQSSSLAIDENGTSISRGIELLIKKRWDHFNSAISYHQAFLDINFPSLSDDSFPANNDQRHNLSWVNYYHHKNYSFGLHYNFRSGLPYTEVSAINFVIEEDEGYYEKEVEGFNDLRLGDFHRLDLSISYGRPFLKDSYLDFQFLLFNVFNFQRTTSRSDILSNLNSTNDEPELFKIEKFQLQRTPQLLVRCSF